MNRYIKKIEQARRLEEKISKQIYRICYKHPAYGSDTLGADFYSIEAALTEIQSIRKDPSQGNWSEWLAEACLWICDESGNIY